MRMVSKPYFATYDPAASEIWFICHITLRERPLCRKYVSGTIIKTMITTVTSPSELGRAINERRRHLGLNQADLASLTGVDQGNLSKIERGQIVATLETYLILLSALGIDLRLEVRR
jgi:ribosome-binding protein aMBF1 (putative translation factor)